MAGAMTGLIAGGGIGGLAAAAALAQRGWSITVFERQPELREAGAGITFSENGLRVLEALGAYDAAMDGANPGTGVELRGVDEEVLDATPLPPRMRLLSSPRRQVLGALQAACARSGVTIVTGREIAGASAGGALRFADGTAAEADLVLGVDGVWSRVRDSLGLAGEHRQTAEGALRTIVAADAADDALFARGRHIESWSGTRRLLIVPLGRGRLYLALTCLASDTDGSRVPVDKATWRASFPHWGHLVERIGTDVTWGVYSIVTTPRWSVGRAAILGDAAHAQPPNLGQGGGMAVQNALALAVALERVQDTAAIPAALAVWEQSVRSLTEHCQKWSVLYGEITTLPDAVRARVVRAAMADPWMVAQLFRAARSEPAGTVASGHHAAG